MINALCIFLLGIVTYTMLYTSFHDDDFKDIKVTKVDKIQLVAYLIAFIVLLIKLPLFPKIYASIALPILMVSAYTDKKTKLLYGVVFYILAPLSIIIETLQSSFYTFNYKTMFSFHLSIQTLAIIIFVMLIELFGMYGNGDKSMALVCGCTWGIFRPKGGVAESLLVECIMILIAECTFYIKGAIEGNLDGPFKLKESRPLGPDLLFATTIVLLGGSFIWVN